MNRKPVFTVPAKSVINFDSGFAKKLLCDGPTFTAGTACPYSCSFCYVPDGMKKQMPWLQKHGVTGKHEDVVIRRANAVDIAIRQLKSHPEKEREKKKVIYASPLTDVAANMELVKETILIVAEILVWTKWDVRLLSKSNLLPQIAKGMDNHPYGPPMGAKERIIYGVSTGTLDDKLAEAFEDGTPKVSKRIESLHWLQDNGFRTFGMICPSLPQDDYLQFSMDMGKAIRFQKCEHVWAEVINVRGESFTRTSMALTEAGFNEESKMLSDVQYGDLWEKYARDTFEAHTMVFPPDKLRFLQYANVKTGVYWNQMRSKGAVLL